MNKEVWVWNKCTLETIGICQRDEQGDIKFPNGTVVKPNDKEFLILELEDVWCCAECGSTDIEEKYWVNPNTQEIIGTSSDEGNYWCNDCNEPTDLTDLETFMRGKRMIGILVDELDKLNENE